jgi:hypothetical protein
MVEILRGRNTNFSLAIGSSRSVERIRLSVFQHSQARERQQPLDLEECDSSIGCHEISTFQEMRV